MREEAAHAEEAAAALCDDGRQLIRSIFFPAQQVKSKHNVTRIARLYGNGKPNG